VWDDYENAHRACSGAGYGAGAEIIEMMSIPEEVLGVEGSITSGRVQSTYIYIHI